MLGYLGSIGAGSARWDRPNCLELEFSASQCGLFTRLLYFLLAEKVFNLKPLRRNPRLAVSNKMGILTTGNIQSVCSMVRWIYISVLLADNS